MGIWIFKDLSKKGDIKMSSDNKRIVYFSGWYVLKNKELSVLAKLTLLKAKLIDKLGLKCSNIELPVGKATITIDPYNPSDWFAFRELVLEKEYSFQMKDRAIIDLGAHKGYFLSVAAKAGAKYIVCYEPEAKNFACLEEVARSLEGTSMTVKVFNQAVSDKPGSQEFYVYEESWSHSLEEREDRKLLTSNKVEVTTLDEIVKSVRKDVPKAPLAIKIDVEGAEDTVLLNVKSETFSETELLVFEYHNFCPRPLGDIMNCLKENSFSEVENIVGSGSNHSLHVLSRG